MSANPPTWSPGRRIAAERLPQGRTIQDFAADLVNQSMKSEPLT